MIVYIKLLIISCLLIPFGCLAQGNNGVKVTYSLNYKKYKDSEDYKTSSFILNCSNASSMFAEDNLMKLDSLSNVKKLIDTDFLVYRSTFKFSIHKNQNKISYSERFGNDVMSYKESINLNWNLKDGEKNLLGYNCKKATVNYGKREWTAWYTTEIPYNSGPYKFQGLPGLILSVIDSDNDFNFVAVGLETAPVRLISKSSDIFKIPNLTYESFEKEDFEKFKLKYSNMTFNQKMEYMNRNKEQKLTYIATDPNTGESVINSKRPSRKKNFIEKL